jgi:hypothetical protein
VISTRVRISFARYADGFTLNASRTVQQHGDASSLSDYTGRSENLDV